jgi:hypothetical protein
MVILTTFYSRQYRETRYDKQRYEKPDIDRSEKYQLKLISPAPNKEILTLEKNVN